MGWGSLARFRSSFAESGAAVLVALLIVIAVLFVAAIKERFTGG